MTNNTITTRVLIFAKEYSHWLTLLPVVICVLYYHLDVPFHDQWDLLPLLDAYYQGRLTLNNLLAPHNGHILLLPQAIMLLLAVCTHWNTFAEVLCSLLLGVINFGLFLTLAKQLTELRLSVLHKSALGLVAFSLAQAENWLWGWQLQIPLCLTFMLAGFVALRCITSHALALMAAGMCGVAACFSFGAGVVFWLAAIPLVFTRLPLLLLPWGVMTAFCLSTYFHLLGISTAEITPHETNWLDYYFITLPASIKHTLICLGSVVARFNNNAALVAGSSGVLGFLLLLRCTPAVDKSLIISLALLGLGASLLISLSRSGMGTEQMLYSRYTTLCLPFWISLLFLVLKHPSLVKTAGVAVLSAIITTSIFSLKDFQRIHKRLVLGEIALEAPESPEGQKALQVIDPRHDSALAQQEVRLLKQYQLSYFRSNKKDYH
jgi:hypothetical protein